MMFRETISGNDDQPITDLTTPSPKPPASVGEDEIRASIEAFVGQKNFPCVPAIKAIASGDYVLDSYSNFGTGESGPELVEKLIAFSEEQARTQSPYSTYFAVYPECEVMDEDEFEEKMWKEISAIVAADKSGAKWDPLFSDDPNDRDFCPSIGGKAFFIVGVHPRSSRLARRFKYPAILFNLYDQFEELDRRGQYENVVKANRKREMAFAGSLNPMVEKHGDKWEAIQFSGKENPDTWKCPFHRFLGLMKK
jgi:FPC/CPF motif-containing protein YcgG